VAADATKDITLGRRALWSTLSNYAGQFVTMGVGFLLTPFILHQLGATAFGLWVLIGSVAGYGSVLEFGIASAVTRYVAVHRARGEDEEIRSLVATALVLYAILGVLAVVLGSVVAWFFPALFELPAEQAQSVRWLVLLAALGVGFSIPAAITTALLRGYYRFDLLNLIGISGTLLTTGVTVAVLLGGGGLPGMLVANITVSVAMQVPAIWLIHRIAPELYLRRRHVKVGRMRSIASFSSSLFVASVSNQLQSKTDEIVIGIFLPLAAVTPYALALRLNHTAQSLARQFAKVLLPMAAELDATNDRVRLRTVYIASTRLALASFLPIGCALVILATPLLTVWVGAAYAGITPLILILTLASLVDMSQWPAGFVLQGMARHKMLAWAAIAAGLVNLALSVVLVQSMGVMGVALGTLIPVAVESLCFVMPYTMRVMKIGIGEAITRIYLPTLAPAIPTAIFLFWVREAFALNTYVAIFAAGGIGLFIYAIGYLGFGASTYERQIYSGFALSTLQLARQRLRAMS
jgi:O-antigen/teichoic acid export membrane protein